MSIHTSKNEDKKFADPIMENIRAQLTMTPKEILESTNNKEYQETVKKIKEIMDDAQDTSGI